MQYSLTGLDGKVAVITGAGRMRSTGRSVALEIARAGCDIVINKSDRLQENYPEKEQQPPQCE